MEHTQSAALRVAARQSCAKATPDEAPCPADRPGFAPMDRWALLDLVTELRKTLKLTTNDIAVLRALLSFLPVRLPAGREGPVTPDTLTVVFASNEAIAQRAGGMDERVLRHAFRRLASAGLLARRDSASGKRFPIRQAGRIVSAYGLDLAPGFVQAPELMREARAQREAAELVRARRAELFARRRHLLERTCDLCATTMEWLADLSTVLRRKLGLGELDTLSEQLTRIEEFVAAKEEPKTTSVTPGNAVEDTRESSASDGRIYRHTESEKIDMQKNTPSIGKAWPDWQDIHSLFPEAPQSVAELREVLCQLAAMLRIRPEALGQAVSRLGWIGLGRALNTMTARVNQIRNPSGYLLAMVHNGGDDGAKAPEPAGGMPAVRFCTHSPLEIPRYSCEM